MQAYSASLRGKFASQTLPPPYKCYLIFSAYHCRSVFLSANRTAPTTTPPWQPIFIPAQGSPNTIKTVGGEAVRRFFSLKYAVLLYTISTLFTDPSLRKQNTSGKFLRARKNFVLATERSGVHFSKKRPRPLASPASYCFIRTRRVIPFERAAQRASISSFVL